MAAVLLLFVLCALGYFFFTKSANSTIKGHISPAKVHRSPEYRSRPSAGDPTRLIGSPTTTIKAQHFLSKPLRDVALRDVPGVGIVVASKLESVGIETAEQLLGEYLKCGRDDGKFENWLVNACGMRAMDARKIVDPIAEKAAKLVRQ